jgi:hypothetical protein
MTRWIMTTSVVFLALCGLAALFAPQELLAYLGVPHNNAVVLIIQLLAATLVAFAIANWMAKDSRIGGIYNRPLALANLLHFAIGAITLVKAFAAGTMTAAFAIVALGYCAFAIAFAVVVFFPPAEPA